MGDLIGKAVEGSLHYLGLAALRRIRELDCGPFRRSELLADACRLNALYMISRAGSGHIGSSFSSLDIATWLHLHELGPDDVYFSSKGHDAPGLYALLIALERLPFELIHRLRQLGGLPGHPDVGTPGMVANTGSLGMGISKAKGFVLAERLRGGRGRVFVMTGDGELQEGQIWESLVSAANLGLHELVVIVDHNKLQSDTLVEKTSSLGDLESKFRAFGLRVERSSGHDPAELSRVLSSIRSERSQPTVIIADTIKGRGVSFMEHTALDSDTKQYRFHSGAPDAAAYARASLELMTRLQERAREAGLASLSFESNEAPRRAPPSGEQRLIEAYGRALEAEVRARPELVVLDADLVVDTGQMPARLAAPPRFVECGIAEMDMVSQAGGLALRGFVPVCHSFACFLSTRANEQIYNNASEQTHVVYAGSLAGLLPAGPGHSHQSVRDISAVGGVPGLVALSPATEDQVASALSWCLREHDGPSWLRLESVPCQVPYELPDEPLELGIGSFLRSGRDALFIGYGPVLLSQAYIAAERLTAFGLSVGVVNLPWLNRIDSAWLLRAVAHVKHVFSLDNHLIVGGQGDRIAAILAESAGARPRLHRCGLETLPVCGRNEEVLQHHRLDAESLVDRVRNAVKTSERVLQKAFDRDTAP